MQVQSDHYSYLDIGNSTAILYYEQGNRVETLSSSVHTLDMEDLAPYIRKTSKLIVSSVVVSMNTYIIEWGEKNQFPIHIAQIQDGGSIQFTHEESQIVGTDLWLQLEGAYSETQSSVVVVALGTAITITAVDDNGKFLGGMLMAGYKKQIEILSQSAEGISSFEPHHWQQREGFFYKETNTSIESGTYWMIYYGLLGIIQQLKKENPHRKIYGTGGLSLYFQDHFDKIESKLIFIGMNKIYKSIIKD